MDYYREKILFYGEIIFNSYTSIYLNDTGVLMLRSFPSPTLSPYFVYGILAGGNLTNTIIRYMVEKEIIEKKRGIYEKD